MAKTEAFTLNISAADDDDDRAVKKLKYSILKSHNP